jgi:TRAP-type C4-dicarboxylate transport system permease small subunit
VPWGIFFLLCWGIVALEMFLETQFGRYPENGFSVVSAYFCGWMYIWFTMIPIGLLYLLFRGIQKLWQKRREKVEK